VQHTALVLWLVSFVALAGSPVGATCEAERCAVQATIDAQCPCGAARDAAAYRRCAARAVVGVATACRPHVLGCLAASTCGREGSVVCEYPQAGGGKTCAIEAAPARCVAHGGAVTSRTSCCSICP
jgi:hypothetical protein